MTMTTRTPDPLLDRLRQLPRATLDDVSAARTLARAEASFATTPVAGPNLLRRWLAPTALACWGLLYLWGSVRELRRIFPGDRSRGPVAEVRSPRSDDGPPLIAARQHAHRRQPSR